MSVRRPPTQYLLVLLQVCHLHHDVRVGRRLVPQQRPVLRIQALACDHVHLRQTTAHTITQLRAILRLPQPPQPPQQQRHHNQHRQEQQQPHTCAQRVCCCARVNRTRPPPPPRMASNVIPASADADNATIPSRSLCSPSVPPAAAPPRRPPRRRPLRPAPAAAPPLRGSPRA